MLLTLVGGALYAGRKGKREAAEISAQVQRWFPGLLALTLSSVGITLLFMVMVFPSVSIGERFTASWLVDLLLGALVGALIAGLYFTLLSPAMTWLQAHIGDYVPPGSVLTTLEGNLPAFFVANVLLAPLVEELWYRGALFTAAEPLGTALSVVLTCLAFGLFHWPGGFWYMLLTGGILGVALVWLRLEQASLLAPYSAHLALNIIEFYVLARRSRTVKKSLIMKENP